MTHTQATPFEIRLELLKISKDSLESSWYATRDKIFDRANEEENLEKREKIRNSLEKFPATEDIVLMAKKLNEFISNK